MKLQEVNPHNYGWYEVKLDPFMVDHLWECIDQKEESMKHRLAGQIDQSYKIPDINFKFWKKYLYPLSERFSKQYGESFVSLPCNGDFVFYFDKFWVNYQNQHEYNPIHDHNGLFSFVIWMKIPTSYQKQVSLHNSKGTNHPVNSTFNFEYQDILGRSRSYMYKLGPEYEGTMLFFPSTLRHIVYPFYNCDEQRISISGNIGLKQPTNG